MRQKAMLIDGNYYLHRIMHVPTFQSMSYNGSFTGGVYGVLKSLSTTMNKYPETNKLVIVWDGRKSVRRMTAYPTYKGNREDDGELKYLVEGVPSTYRQALEYQKTLVIQITNLLRCHNVSQIEMEADDIIGKIAAEPELFGLEDYDFIICTDDKDYHQLVSETAIVYKPIKDLEVNKNNFQEITNIRHPTFYKVFHALCGDGADNIPGVPGWGGTTAQKAVEYLQDRMETATDLELIVGHLEAFAESKVRNANKILNTSEYGLTGIQIFRRNFSLVDLTLEDFIPEDIITIKEAIFSDTIDGSLLQQFAVPTFIGLGMNSLVSHYSYNFDKFQFLH